VPSKKKIITFTVLGLIAMALGYWYGMPDTNSEEASTPTPPNVFVNTLGMKFVPVPGTKVQFCIWETRVKDYAAYAAANADVDARWKNPFPSFKQTGTHPVVRVRWNEAQGFCAWLTKKELAAGKIKAGQRYRLPTDAEWSVAVGLGKEKGNTPKEKSGRNTDVLPWGKGWPPPKGAGNYDEDLKVDRFKYTSPVGSFAANQHGLHDLSGNVWEWCEDLFDPSRKETLVIRGGECGDPKPFLLVSSYRFPNAFSTRGYGFRCVLTDGSGQ
jgi:formylglycine-generating enzyme required for sulfatase activity